MKFAQCAISQYVEDVAPILEEKHINYQVDLRSALCAVFGWNCARCYLSTCPHSELFRQLPVVETSRVEPLTFRGSAASW